MGFIRKAASIMMLGGVSGHTRRELSGKAERARTKAERARRKPRRRRYLTRPGGAQTSAWACARPEATASASAVWSRSVWSA
jgi:hypothetical protein